MSKTEQLEGIAHELEAYGSGYSVDTLASCLYSAVKVLVRDNRFNAVGQRLLTALDAAYAGRPGKETS